MAAKPTFEKPLLNPSFLMGSGFVVSKNEWCYCKQMLTWIRGLTNYPILLMIIGCAT